MPHLNLSTITLLFIVYTFLLFSTVTEAATENHLHRRLLHQPFYPLDQSLPPETATTISQPPFPSPSPQPQPFNQQPRYPFSTLSPPDATTQNPFFPSFPSPPPPPPTPSSSTAFATFPANISSLVLPSSTHSSHKPIKLISLIVSVSLLSVIVFACFFFLLHRHRHRQPLKTDSLRLFPPNTTPSDTTTTTTNDNSKKPPPPLFPRHTSSSSSSEFLYLGTVVSSRDANVGSTATQSDAKTPPAASVSINYQRLGSPELQPLPPLPRQQSQQNYHDTHVSSSQGEENDNDDEEEEFFSPRGSTGNNASPYRTKSSPPLNNFSNKNANDFNGSRSLNSLNCNSPVYSVSPDDSPSVILHTGSPQSIESKSPDSLVTFPVPLPRFIPPPPARVPRTFSAFSPSSTEEGGTRDCSPRASDYSGVGNVPAPPPPPPVRFWESAPPTGPPELVAPSRKVVIQSINGEKRSLGNVEGKGEEMMKPKLKPLHWDKVRASSDRAMVWDQLKSSSFQ